jgi:hypothetical protein
MAAIVVVMVLAKTLEYALVIGQSDQQVVIALLFVVRAELVVIAGPVVMMALVMVDPVVMPLMVVVIARPVEMAELVEYALVLPPLVVVMVLARYDPEHLKVVDQSVRYLIYATEWYYQRIFQGNSSHLQWGCLSHCPHSLISRVAPLVCMHIGAGLVFPQINTQPDSPVHWQLLLSSQLYRSDRATSREYFLLCNLPSMVVLW